MRQPGSTLIKLLGVYHAAWWVEGVASLAGSLHMPLPDVPFVQSGQLTRRLDSRAEGDPQ